MRRVHVFEPLGFWGRNHSETCFQICNVWKQMGHDVTIHTVIAHRPDPDGVLKPTVPKWVPGGLKARIDSRFRRPLWRWTERRATAAVRPGDICYFWPGSSAPGVAACKRAGAVTVVEFINTHAGSYHSIMRTAAAEFGLEHRGDEEESRSYDDSLLAAADIAIAPSPLVFDSIRRHGKTVPMLLKASYGAKYPATVPEKQPNPARLRFLFVGSFGLRKGAPYLLDAWEQADLDADLLIAGSVDPGIREKLSKGYRNVHLLGFRKDVHELYAGADVFVFPSLEEGDPQVTHEAAAHGLPLIVTPMGGGSAADDRNSLMVPPRDPGALAEAMKRLATEPETRMKMAQAARMSARHFDWRAVAERRIYQLLEAADAIDPNRVTRAAKPSSA